MDGEGSGGKGSSPGVISGNISFECENTCVRNEGEEYLRGVWRGQEDKMSRG